MQKLMSRQAEILSFIKRYLEDHDFPPTRAKIAQGLGSKPSNVVEKHLKTLAHKGAVEMTPSASRGIRIPGFEPHVANDDRGLPVIGRVAVGTPILAEQNIEESCRINPAFFNPRADYLLCVRGMNTKDVGILDGDLLTIHVTCEMRNGQVVVVRIGEEVTVKCFKRENSRVRLLAEDPEFAPIGVSLEGQELIAEGLNVGVI